MNKFKKTTLATLLSVLTSGIAFSATPPSTEDKVNAAILAIADLDKVVVEPQETEKKDGYKGGQYRELEN